MELWTASFLFLGAMASAAPAAIEIPGGSGGIGFDDLRFSVSLGKILVPAGRAGSLVLLDPATRSVTAIEGFSSKKEYGGGHDDGVTSADSGSGWIFATDRTSGLIAVIDPGNRRIVSRSKLGGAPDYVRYVEPVGEVWVTEPDSERIEIFHLLAGIPPAAVHEAFLSVPGGPESLVVDIRRGRAYTHLWNGKTVATTRNSRICIFRARRAGRWPCSVYRPGASCRFSARGPRHRARTVSRPTGTETSSSAIRRRGASWSFGTRSNEEVCGPLE
jgi:hypothetical protein